MTNALISAINQLPTARTFNGAPTNPTSGNTLVDLFSIVGASRGKDISAPFTKALSSDWYLTARLLQWARDVRGGAGERDTFRKLLTDLIQKRPEVAELVLLKTPEVGRWDDVLVALNTPLQPLAVEMIRHALVTDQNGLAAKWMPRKGEVAATLRNALGLSPRNYRRLLVDLSNTVEQAMCAGDWSKIDFSKLPSKAFGKYKKAFKRREGDRFAAFLTKVEKGEAKINASAIFPHDIVKQVLHTADKAADLQWKALPNYLEGTGERPMVVMDVSGSMSTPVSQGTRAMDVSVALGLYLSERMEGPFRDHVITFHTSPTLFKVTGSLSERVKKALQAPWGGSTDFQAVFDMVLKAAQRDRVAKDQMPTMIICVSDMEFNMANGRGNTNFEVIKQKYAAAGYEMPKLVFWNVCAREGNSPVRVGDKNTAMVSGFSPAVVKSVFACKNVTPYEVMLEALMSSRYDLPGEVRS